MHNCQASNYTTSRGARVFGGEDVGVRQWRLQPLVFFFSSRRRHTRLQGDWSSDVCSSDLLNALEIDASYAYRQTWSAGLGLFDTSGGRDATRYGPNPFDGSNNGSPDTRSEGRRVGKEGRSRWAPDHLKKKKQV